MWKKDEEQSTKPATPRPTQTVARAPSTGGGRATIGPSISIDGDVTGSEDLLIEGEVRGSVHLDQHAVAVGGQGRVQADVEGRVITVEGRVEGNLTALEQIVLRGSAHVQGDIKAPRVVLEDGANFRGLVDMGPTPASKKKTETAHGRSDESARRDPTSPELRDKSESPAARPTKAGAGPDVTPKKATA